jgi:hypothetical protein
MHDFVDESLRPILAAAGLDSFEALWALETPWFEPPNRRRGGWSGVARIGLADGEGSRQGFFLKRQENHTRWSPAHPVRGEPTFAAEMRNILGLRRSGVPTLEPVFFAQRRMEGHWRVVLVTRELGGYRPLDAFTKEWQAAGWSQTRMLRRQVLAVAAPAIRRMHLAGFQHRALHPKHVFVKTDQAGRVGVCLIDLEKMRRRPFSFRNALRDLDSLNRRSPHWSRTDRLRFLKRYLGTERLDWRGRLLWRLLVRRRAASVSAEGGDRG